MNRKSEIMVEREVVAHQDVEQKIISEYNTKLEDKELASEIKVFVTKDIAADEANYQALVEQISIALIKIRDMRSIRLYGKTYDKLEETEKGVEELEQCFSYITDEMDYLFSMPDKMLINVSQQVQNNLYEVSEQIRIANQYGENELRTQFEASFQAWRTNLVQRIGLGAN